MTISALSFPLVERADRLGVLDGRSAFVVAPTATGKSHIGHEAIRRALRGGGGDELHAYLVPYRALAREIYDGFLRMLDGSHVRARLLTGDHRDPLRPDQADLVVATYESFAALVRSQPVRPGIVVADEVHLLADEQRGPLVEGLLAQLLTDHGARGLLALSAVVDNADELAEWLGVPVVRGTVADRPVGLQLGDRVVDDLDDAVLNLLRDCPDQALVFCSSRPGAERTAALLADRLGLPARTMPALEEESDPVLDLLPRGVAYHHAGLPGPVRQHVERLYRDGTIRVIACTPTLAAGVNLPSGAVVVRDVFRREAVRGRYRPVLLPTGEVLNMLGRAGRPGQVTGGRATVLVERAHVAEVGNLLTAIRAGRGGRVDSRLTARFESLMRFVLAVVVARGETTRDDIVGTFRRTLAHHSDPAEVSFDRTLRDDLMEDLRAYERARRDGVHMVDHQLTAEGVDAVVDSKGRQYDVRLRITGCRCDCPAGSRYYREQVCKHQALVVHELLFGEHVDAESRARALYLCGHVFGGVLDIGTRLAEALHLLVRWELVEQIPGGWRATGLGEVASASGFDLLLVHQVAERLRHTGSADHREIARWAVADLYADAKQRDRWTTAIERWLAEENLREGGLPTRYRGDFEQGVDRLAQVCRLYEQAARRLGREQLAAAARDAAGAVCYGVAPELVPLMALNFPQLRRARARYLHDRGVRDLTGLANADPAALADPRRVPLAYLTDWVDRARQLHAARAVAVADRDEHPAEFDELVARFRVDPAAL
ncbi:DEAD/DEAH box helicase [Gandjariella thermophila]|uniref:DEAD/DEAH box helicase n=1 Tax=Gandjariella thermophila TaxID=1931992 RepID=UPI001864BEEE|nr:DEAD/DEAH box helicase [Gandjariella thermophila]